MVISADVFEVRDCAHSMLIWMISNIYFCVAFLVKPISAEGINFKFVTECFFLTHECFKVGKSEVFMFFMLFYNRSRRLTQDNTSKNAALLHAIRLEVYL